MAEPPASRSPAPAPRSPIWAQALALNALSDPRFVPLAIGGLLGAMVLRGALEPFGDQDVGWLAAAGRALLATGEVPRTNGWGVTDAALPWTMHEWALGPLYALALAHAGLAGAVSLGIAAAALTTALLALGTIGRARSLGAGALACVLAMLAARECLVEPRPAYLLLGAPLAMALLAVRERFSRAHAAAAIALELAWTQLHGSFPLGLAVLAAAALAHERDRPARIAALALSALATLLNPYGLALFGLVGRYVVGGDDAAEAIHAHIAEFQPLWAAGPVFGHPVRVLGVVLVVTGASEGVLRGARAERFAAGLALALGLLAVLHARYVPQAVTLGAVLLVPRLDAALANVALARPAFEGVAVARRTAMASAAVSLLALGLVLARGTHADDALGGDALPSLARDPRAAGRPAYVAFDAAGRYLWLAPAPARVFFDPRNDCYAAETARTAFAIEEGECTGSCLETALAPVEVAIVPTTHAIHPSFAASAAWTEVRALDDWHLFVRR